MEPVACERGGGGGVGMLLKWLFTACLHHSLEKRYFVTTNFISSVIIKAKKIARIDLLSLRITVDIYSETLPTK